LIVASAALILAFLTAKIGTEIPSVLAPIEQPETI